MPASLAHDLRGVLACEVRFDPGARALYAEDASPYRQVPLGVVLPRSIADVEAAVAVCRAHDAPVFLRGGGTSLAGQTCNQAVVLDLSRHLNRVRKIHPRARTAEVEPGCVLDDLRDRAEQHGLTFAPDPATHNRCTLGGMIGNNSCGVHSLMGGKTVDNVESLDILLYDGTRMTVGREPPRHPSAREAEIYAALGRLVGRYGDLVRARYPKIPRRVSGYNLDQLLPENGFHVARALVGSESTCAIVLGATLRLVHSPKARPLLALGYPDVYTAGDHVCELLECKPIGLEGFDDVLLNYYLKRRDPHPGAHLLPPGGGWLLAEFGADHMADAEARARAAMRVLARQPHAPAMRLFTDPGEVRAVWKIREGGVGVTTYMPNGKVAWAGWEDSAVPPEVLGRYLRALRDLLRKFQLEGAMFGHFGQACLHLRLDFNLRTADGVAAFRRFMEEAADLVVSFGGSLSGEHGDGQIRAELVPKMLGHELVRGLEEFKAIWDPAGRMNPGKMVHPLPLDHGLRLGPAYRPARPATHFQFPGDRGDFSTATLRCQGLGVCRREDTAATGGVMCPSYMVTREEQHSTRGRAHLLWEMLQGDLVRDGWRARPVKEALDLCLSCKGCKRDCPIEVDMATYKAEFLSHYYQGRLRPRAAYTMGLIREWAELASHAPALANFVAQTPVLRTAAKLAAGVSVHRSLPRFAPRTLAETFQPSPGPPVLLLADTFTNFFHPEIGHAAASVLASAGFGPRLVTGVCCGRPLYDYGMLDRAKRRARQAVAALRDDMAQGLKLVVLEPSCAAVFRDELVNLFPHDEDARRLSRQTLSLPEFLDQVPGYQPPRRARPAKALLQIHCHQHALLRGEIEAPLLERAGVNAENLEAGCCGMAGSFGFEARHREVSMAVGERRLLPAVRQAPPDTLIVADGFSCREQIRQATGRRALHLAEVLAANAESAPPPASAKRGFAAVAAALTAVAAVGLFVLLRR